MNHRHAMGAILGACCFAATPAWAQSSVQLGGQIKIGLDRVSYSGARQAQGPVTGLSASRLTDNSSYYFFKGEEDLGGGIKALFHLERSFAANSGAEGSARFSAVGMSHTQWGRLMLGRWSTYFASDSMLTPSGIRDAGPYGAGTLNLLGSIGRRGAYFAGGFLNDLIRYDSPDMAGFRVAAAYGFQTTSGNRSFDRVLNLNPTYVKGPLTLYANVLSRDRQPGAPGNFTTDYDQLAWRMGAGYAFRNGWSVAALFDRNRVKGSAVPAGSLVRSAWAIPVRYSRGLHEFHVTYGQARPYEAASTPVQDTGASMLSLGYEYKLSKRTAVAASFSTVRNQAQAGYDFWMPSNVLAAAAGTTGFSSRYTYLGIKHSF